MTAEDIGLEDAVTIADGGTMTPPEGLTGPYTLIFTEETSDVVSGALVVHVTMSSETSGTPDSTYEEIEAAIEAGRVVIAEIPSIPGQPSTVEVALQLASPQVGPLEGIMFFSIIDSISAVFPSRALLILTINASSQASLRIISLQKELEGT